MNKEHLENKIWYRTLKVLFFASFVSVQLLGLYITFSVTSSTREFVKCTNGKEFENPYYGLEFYKFSNETDLTGRCENSNINNSQTQKSYTYEELLKMGATPIDNNSQNFDPLNYGATPVGFVPYVPDKLPYSKYEKAQYTPIERGAFLLGSIIVISFVFWFTAKIFFYIILGEKLFPLKKRNNNQN